MSVTPQKRRNTDDSFHSPSTKQWKTPAKGQGKSVDITGYVLLVGHETRSQSNNPYFDIVIQRAKADTARVRLMMDANLKRDEFLELLTSEKSTTNVYFKSVMSTGDFYLFSVKSGSSYSFSSTTLGFLPTSFAQFTTALKNAESHVHSEMDIHSQMMYIGGVKYNPQNGSPYKNAVFYDGQTEMFATIWNKDYFQLEEHIKMFFTNLKRKDYFGVLLYTTSKTIIMPSNMESIERLPADRLTPFILRSANVQNPSQITTECIIGATFQSTRPCTSKTCDGIIQEPAEGNRGICNKCPKRVNIQVVKKKIHGEIDVNDMTLSVDRDCIDATFGEGVCETYLNAPEELADKFLEMKDVTIMYDGKKKKSILIQ